MQVMMFSWPSQYQAKNKIYVLQNGPLFRVFLRNQATINAFCHPCCGCCGHKMHSASSLWNPDKLHIILDVKSEKHVRQAKYSLGNYLNYGHCKRKVVMVLRGIKGAPYSSFFGLLLKNSTREIFICIH